MSFFESVISAGPPLSNRVANIENSPLAIPLASALIPPLQSASGAAAPHAPGPPRPEGQYRVNAVEPSSGKIPDVKRLHGLIQNRRPWRERCTSVRANLWKVGDQCFHEQPGQPLMERVSRAGRRMPCLVQDMLQFLVEPRQEISLFSNVKQVLVEMAGQIGF